MIRCFWCFLPPELLDQILELISKRLFDGQEPTRCCNGGKLEIEGQVVVYVDYRKEKDHGGADENGPLRTKVFTALYDDRSRLEFTLSMLNLLQEQAGCPSQIAIMVDQTHGNGLLKFLGAEFKGQHPERYSHLVSTSGLIDTVGRIQLCVTSLSESTSGARHEAAREVRASLSETAQGDNSFLSQVYGWSVTRLGDRSFEAQLGAGRPVES